LLDLPALDLPITIGPESIREQSIHVDRHRRPRRAVGHFVPVSLMMHGRSAVQEPAKPLSPPVTKPESFVQPAFDEVCEETGITLTRYMMEVSRANPHMRELES
jgi:hypothetical protein